MVTRSIDAMAELQNAFQALTKNWILALPTGVASLIATAFFLFVVAATLASVAGAGILGSNNAGGAGAALAGAGGLTAIVGGIIIVLLLLLANATVVGAAENVWRGQPADLSGGLQRAMNKLPALFVLFLIGIVAAIICGVLVIALGLGILLALVLGFFFMYAIPAIVVGNQGAVEALGTSYRLVRANIQASLTAFLGIIVVSIVGDIVIRLFHFIPLLGVIVAFFVGGLTAAYAALVAVRFYDLLRGPATQVSPSSGPTA
jgi:hypothetical protein